MASKTPETHSMDFRDAEFRFINQTTRAEVLRVIECRNTLHQYGNHAIRHLMAELKHV